MLPKPTTGGSKTRNLGFGTPHHAADTSRPRSRERRQHYWRPSGEDDPHERRTHGFASINPSNASDRS
jgi:hypothetical protein